MLSEGKLIQQYARIEKSASAQSELARIRKDRFSPQYYNINWWIVYPLTTLNGGQCVVVYPPAILKFRTVYR
jgi:hypothetical protein